MKDFIDKTDAKDGTPINRANLLAAQDFISNTITFGSSGTITERNADGETLTVTFGSDGSITETFTGEKTVTKKTTFSGNTITEKVT